MKIAGPTLIHYLSLHLGHEIEHLFPDYPNHVPLPGFQIARMLHDETDNILFRLRGESTKHGRHGFLFNPRLVIRCQAEQVVKLRLSLLILGLRLWALGLTGRLLAEPALRVNVLLNREHRVEETLDLLLAVLVLVVAYTRGVERSGLHHVTVGP